jgi:hypothetical protein
MSYFNRLELLDFTLGSISKSNFNDLEIVIVDDFSDNDQKITPSLFQKHNLTNFKIVEMASLFEKKTYVNPCVPYNVGFRNSSGEKIIIQNPECCHVGDLISYVENNLSNSNYLSFHCYASTQEDIKKLHSGHSINFNSIGSGTTDIGNWYNHKSFRPVGYHFTSAITRDNLKKLNGFDERYAHGRDYDDNEFFQRVNFMNLNIQFVEEPFVIHQWHGRVTNYHSPKPTVNNKDLFHELRKNPTVRANNSKNI